MNQENQPQGENSKKISRTTIVAVLLIIFVGAGIINYMMRQEMTQHIQTLENEIKVLQDQKKSDENSDSSNQNSSTQSNTAQTALNKSLLLAVKNKNQNPPPANSENLMVEYSIMARNQQTNQEKAVAIIKNNFFQHPFGFSDNKVFFLTPSGELGTFNLLTQQEQVIKIPGIIPTDQYLDNETLSDFLLTDNKIFYLRGQCAEGEYCALGMYDLATSGNKILIDNVQDKVDYVLFSSFGLMSYDSSKNTLALSYSGGDGPGMWMKKYEVNIDTKAITQKDSAESFYCAENDPNCTPEDRAANEKFLKLATMVYTCNGSEISHYYDGVTISGKKMEDTFYVGCVE